MSSILDIVVKVWIFLLFGATWFILFVVFWYLTDLIQSVYSWFAVIGWSCADIQLVSTLSSTLILFMLISYIYKVWIRR